MPEACDCKSVGLTGARTVQKRGWGLIRIADALHASHAFVGSRVPGWRLQGVAGVWIIRKMCDRFRLASSSSCVASSTMTASDDAIRGCRGRLVLWWIKDVSALSTSDICSPTHPLVSSQRGAHLDSAHVSTGRTSRLGARLDWAHVSTRRTSRTPPCNAICGSGTVLTSSLQVSSLLPAQGASLVLGQLLLATNSYLPDLRHGPFRVQHPPLWIPFGQRRGAPDRRGLIVGIHRRGIGKNNAGLKEGCKMVGPLEPLALLEVGSSSLLRDFTSSQHCAIASISSSEKYR
eukprot:scaffold876_cov243-Pinguiococcus_pyrenoidosus.AAC.34